MLSLDYIFYYKEGEYYDREKLNAAFEPEISRVISLLLEKILSCYRHKTV
ncbi:MAG: hypothetical protein GX345_00915 [Clostridiales bacterium]|jgi:hypothetical protein|nr:hypothetical protein [Clostridiales bacterium]